MYVCKCFGFNKKKYQNRCGLRCLNRPKVSMGFLYFVIFGIFVSDFDTTTDPDLFEFLS